MDQLCTAAFIRRAVVTPALRIGGMTAGDVAEDVCPRACLPFVKFDERAVRQYAAARREEGLDCHRLNTGRAYSYDHGVRQEHIPELIHRDRASTAIVEGSIEVGDEGIDDRIVILIER